MKKYRILIAGQPNTGKTTLFNYLTGASEKTGNFPGVTVRPQIKETQDEETRAEWVDLPGAYGLHPRSPEEEAVLETFLDPDHTRDAAVITAVPEQLERNLLFLAQAASTGKPVVLVLTRTGAGKTKGIKINMKGLEKALGIPVLEFDPREDPARFRKRILKILESRPASPPSFFNPERVMTPAFRKIRDAYPHINPYILWLVYTEFPRLSDRLKKHFDPELFSGNHRKLIPQKVKTETVDFMKQLSPLFRRYVHRDEKESSLSRWDRWILHPLGGAALFAGFIFIFFQVLFVAGGLPSEALARMLNYAGELPARILPEGLWTSLIVDGILPGMGAVLVFVPQIWLLFFMIHVLEQSGLMARLVVLTDRLFRKAGLSGYSAVPLLSATACAVPAVMSTRIIPDRRTRWATMMALPYVTCSARLPVYVWIISALIPPDEGKIFLRGIVMGILYFLGFAAALVSARLWQGKSPSAPPLFMEWPALSFPRLPEAVRAAWRQTRLFLTGAGPYIFGFSVLVWALSSFGPAPNAGIRYGVIPDESFLGHMGRMIEPLFRPLGWNWPLTVAVLASFAARETFVSVMAVLDHPSPSELPLPVALSLLTFYVLAMQCFSTLAVQYKETRSLKYPLLLWFYMTGSAWVAAWVVFKAAELLG